METLKLNKATAIRLYPKANAEFKEMLTETFGKETFSQKITDRIKTFEDASDAIEVSANQKILLDYNGIDKDMLAAKAFLKITIIAKALNEEWKPDWKDSSQYKYYPWFDLSSGSGLSYDAYGTWYSTSNVGSRLCFKSRELAEYAGKQFIELYKDLMIL